MAKIRVAVLFGGATKDHKLSLRSAYSVLNGLSREKYDITPLGITRGGRWLYFPGDYNEIPTGEWENNSDCCSAVISPDPLHAGILTVMDDGTTAFKRVDVVFSALHGKYGEGGRIQGLLKLAKIPYCDCNPDTAGYCIDKKMTHALLREAGIPVPRFTCLERGDMNDIDNKIKDVETQLRYPVYVSASSCSSSIGADLATNTEELKKAAKIAFSHHHTAIVEEFLTGRSLCCIVTGGTYDIRVSSIGETVKNALKSEFAGYTAEFVPNAQLTAEQKKQISDYAVRAYKILNFSGFAKISFVLNNGEILLRRVTALPGFSEESAMPMLMSESGYEYGEMLDMLITSAIEG